jgi:hypothetical protein
MGADDVDGLLDAPASGDDILGDKKTFARSDLKTSQHKTPVPVLLDEDVACPKVPGNFLTNNDATHRG